MSRHLAAARQFAIAAVAVTISALSPLSAQTTFDFANLGNPTASRPQFLPTNGSVCTGNDRCGTLGGPLNFSKGLFSVSAYAYFNGAAAVTVQDSESGYNGNNDGLGTRGAGLGVYSARTTSGGFVTSDDNITTGETLKLSFNSVVTMQWIGMRSEGHNFTSWTNNSVFQYSLNGDDWFTELLPKNSGQFMLNETSQDFYFRFANGTLPSGQVADQFYISAATVSAPDGFEVPEPSTYALLALGFLSLGGVARRRGIRAS